MKTDWQRLSYPRLCGLLAVRPSRLSQAMHSAGFQTLSEPFSYVAFDTQRTEVALSAMREMGIRGFSLTIPHKENAMGLVDALSPEAVSIGAINTVVNTGEKLLGYNTDWYGVTKALEEGSFDAAGKKALVFGAGGASRAAVYALKQLGLEKISICNRTDKRAKDLATVFSIDFLPYAEMEGFDFSTISLFINCTPIGLEIAGPDASYPFEFDVFGQHHTVFDMVTRDTALLEGARASGATTVAGIRMLFHQAIQQFELFSEQTAPKDVIEAALHAAIE